MESQDPKPGGPKGAACHRDYADLVPICPVSIKKGRARKKIIRNTAIPKIMASCIIIKNKNAASTKKKNLQAAAAKTDKGSNRCVFR